MLPWSEHLIQSKTVRRQLWVPWDLPHGNSHSPENIWLLCCDCKV